MWLLETDPSDIIKNSFYIISSVARVDWSVKGLFKNIFQKGKNYIWMVAQSVLTLSQKLGFSSLQKKSNEIFANKKIGWKTAASREI